MRITFFFFMALLFSGCAAKKLVVENADTLLSHQITKRLPLYSKQKENLNKDIDKFLNKKKTLAQEVLPILDEIDLKDEDKVEEHYKKLEEFFMTLSKDFSALMAKYIVMLDEKQQKGFFNTLDDENREMLKWESEERLDKMEDRFKTFFGSIKGKQKQLLREYSGYFENRAKQRLERRVKLHKEFRKILISDVSPESREKEVQEAFIEYQNAAQEGTKNLEMLKKLLPTISSSQREHFREQLLQVKEMLKFFLTTDY